jgi:hypothetical protein
VLRQQTISYKTYIKETLTEAMSAVFAGHPDSILQEKVNVSVNLPMTETEYPAVIVRYFERNIHNLGVGHQEYLQVFDEDGEPTGQAIRFKHFGYSGDVEFSVYGLSSPDRDLVSDSIVQTLTMGETETYSKVFFNRIYFPDYTTDPKGEEHFVNLNTDNLMGFGESEVIAPWMPEDVLVYQTSYRVPITGEFYSRVPDDTVGIIGDVELYPYSPEAGETPPVGDPANTNPWLDDSSQFFWF